MMNKTCDCLQRWVWYECLGALCVSFTSFSWGFAPRTVFEGAPVKTCLFPRAHFQYFVPGGPFETTLEQSGQQIVALGMPIH